MGYFVPYGVVNSDLAIRSDAIATRCIYEGGMFSAQAVAQISAEAANWKAVMGRSARNFPRWKCCPFFPEKG